LADHADPSWFVLFLRRAFVAAGVPVVSAIVSVAGSFRVLLVFQHKC